MFSCTMFVVALISLFLGLASGNPIELNQTSQVEMGSAIFIWFPLQSFDSNDTLRLKREDVFTPPVNASGPTTQFETKLESPRGWTSQVRFLHQFKEGAQPASNPATTTTTTTTAAASSGRMNERVELTSTPATTTASPRRRNEVPELTSTPATTSHQNTATARQTVQFDVEDAPKLFELMHNANFSVHFALDDVTPNATMLIINMELVIRQSNAPSNGSKEME